MGKRRVVEWQDGRVVGVRWVDGDEPAVQPAVNAFPVDDSLWLPPLCAVPEVTVVVRTYGEPAAWLAAAVESVLDQEGVTVEVLVVDDHGDPAATVPDDPRVGLLRMPVNLGHAATRNAGVERARGEFVRVHDADDELPAGALAAQVAELRRTRAQAVAGKLEPFGDPELVKLALIRGEWCQHVWLKDAWDGRRGTLGKLLLTDDRTLVPGPSLLWRRGWVGECPPDFGSCEDAASYKIALAADPTGIVWLDEVVLRYRIHTGATTARGPGADGPLRRRIMTTRMGMGTRLGRHEALALRAKRPKQIAFLDWSIDAGGAQWSICLLAKHLDRRLCRPLFLAAANSPGTAWLRRQGIEVLVQPPGGSYHEWAAETVHARKVDAVDTAWQTSLIGDRTAAGSRACYAHAQSTDLTSAGLGPGADLTRYDRIVCVSQGVLDANPHFGDLAVVIPSPVDGQAHRQAAVHRPALRAALGLGPEEVAVLWSGRLAGVEKRTGDLREIAEQLAGTNLRLVIAGHIWEGHRDADGIRADWRDWAARHNVTWLDGLWPWQMPAVCGACDLYLSTSEREGLSLSLLEGMASGLAPVVTRVGGVVEVIEPEVNGLVVEPGDVAGLTAGLRRLGNDAGERQAMGKLCRLVAPGLCDVREAARRHALVYWGEE